MHLVPSSVVTLIFFIGIAGLFWLDRDPDLHTSKALWLPLIWVLINGSRPVSMWLGLSAHVSGAEAYSDVYLEGSPIDRFVFLALVIAGLAVLFSRAYQVKPLLRENWPILLFFAYALSSMAWSGFAFVTFKHWIKGIGDVVMVLVFVTEPDLVAATRRLISRVGFLLLPLSMLFCREYPKLGRQLSNSFTLQYTGVTTQKNSLGMLCVVFGLGFIWRFRAVYKDRENPCRLQRLVAYGAVLGIILWLLRASRSMTSVACLLAGGAVVILAPRLVAAWRSWLVHVGVAGMCALSVFALFLDPGGGLVGVLGRNTTLTGRTLVWHTILQFAGNPWVGTGYESFWLGDRLLKIWACFTNFYVNEAHNGYLEIYLTLGWIGLAFLALILMKGYRKLAAALPIDPELTSLCLAWFLAGLLHNLTEAGFRMLTLSWIFILLAIMAASVIAAPEEMDLEVDQSRPLREKYAQVEPAVGAGVWYGE